ncbi:MAG: hypothetical protein ABIQ39_00355, partial [Ilumatobacteraceae bacterium]
AQLRLAAPAVSERDTGETRDSVPVLDGLPSPTAGTPATPAAPLPPSSSLPPKRADFRDSYSAVELCALAGISAEQLAEIESFGLVSGRGSGTQALYTGSDLDIATAAAGFLHRGVEGRHLRAWRQAAEREASLFEQLILPQLRQRNPQSREQAVKTLTELSKLGAELRSAILYSALRHHLEGGSSF